jgi:hypothetical protein
MRHQIKNIQAEANVSYAASWRKAMCIRNAFSPTSIGATGHTNNATVATIVVSMANASSASLLQWQSRQQKMQQQEESPPSMKTRTSSPVASMVSMPRTCTKSAVPTCAIKRIRNCAQTTMSTSMTVITMTIVTRVAMMSHAGACILPCPAMAMQAQATRAQPRRIFTYVRVKRTRKKIGRCAFFFLLSQERQYFKEAS